MVPVERLEEVEFLHDIALSYLKQIAPLAEVKEYRPNTFIFREGDVGRFIYLVADGHVALEVGVPGQGAVQIDTVGVGELLGWSPVLGTGPMTASARTVTPCQLIALDAARLSALCARNPTFGMEFIRRMASVLARRLSSTRMQLVDFYQLERRRPEEGSGLYVIPGAR
jgi:CRP-like cAMP-binding protein